MRKHEKLSNYDLAGLLLNKANSDIEFRGQYEEELMERDLRNQKAVLTLVQTANHKYYMKLMELCIMDASKKSSSKIYDFNGKKVVAPGKYSIIKSGTNTKRDEFKADDIHVKKIENPFNQPQPIKEAKEIIVTEEFTAIAREIHSGNSEKLIVPKGSKLIKISNDFYNVEIPGKGVWSCEAEDINAYLVGTKLPSIAEMLDSIQFAVRVYKFEPNSMFDTLHSIYEQAEEFKSKYANTSTLG